MTREEIYQKYCVPCEAEGRDYGHCRCDICQHGEEIRETYGPTNKVQAKDDPVNHPSHYTAGGIECIDAITAAISCQKDPVNAWLTAQCLKYLWRWPLKNGLEDLKKTRFYLDRLIERLEKEEEGK